MTIGVAAATEGVGGGLMEIGLSQKLGEAAVVGVSGMTRESASSGCSKSQATPCFIQLPQRGWISSHWIEGACQWQSIPHLGPLVSGLITFIFLALHRQHPALDFLCDLRGGIAEVVGLSLQLTLDVRRHNHLTMLKTNKAGKQE